MSSRNMPFWHKDYFELFILRKESHRRNSENRIAGTLLKGKFHPYRIFPFVKVALTIRKRRTKSLDSCH
jgi:hypothetical protein